ncbi:MAG: hypothetical protein NXI15_16300 [Gammaproteobacteria bacterium]|nr:hypothetical protein [Gammaproteobacteria bacterium]
MTTRLPVASSPAGVVSALVPEDSLTDIRSGFDQLQAAVLEQAHVPAVTLSLCRLRVLQLHGIEVETPPGAASGQAGSTGTAALADPQGRGHCVGNWHREKIFSPAEKACLQFTEIYVMDVQAITDDMAADVKQHYGDAGLVVLIEALGLFDATARLQRLWLSRPAGK